MCEALRELFADEFEEREYKGRMLQTIDLVCRKLKKQKSEAAIADELEIELSSVRQICQIARAFAPEYCVEEIYKKWQEICS